MAAPLSMPRAPGVRRFKRRKAPGAPTLRPIKERDELLRSDERQFEEEYARWARGTRPEFIVWKYLVYNKKLKEGVDFLFQSSRFGGRMIFGGVVVDFWIVPFRTMWRVQGERFHRLETPDRVKDVIDKARLEGMGYRVIDLWVRDLETRPTYVLDLAWKGQEVPELTT